MDEELRTHLKAMEARFEAMDARLDGVEARSEAMEARLITHVSVECEKIETKLLTEFHKWGRTSEMRNAAGDDRCRLPQRALDGD